MRPQRASHPKTYLKLHREYKLYYFLAILYGTRKQIFMTFAPWVLVTIFKQPTQTMATLFMVGGIIGIVFQPILGNMIDKFGEKVVLTAEAILLALVCFFYGFSRSLVPRNRGAVDHLWLLSDRPDPDVGQHGPRHLYAQDRPHP